MANSNLPGDKLLTAELALASHVSKETITRIVHSTNMSWLLEEPYFHLGKRMFAEEEARNIMIVSDLLRAGIPLPIAAGWVVSIGEQLMFCASGEAHIEFRRNGRTFAFLNEDGNDAAEAAGPLRFRLTIDLGGYRAAFRDALAARRPADRAAA